MIDLEKTDSKVKLVQLRKNFDGEWERERGGGGGRKKFQAGECNK